MKSFKNKYSVIILSLLVFLALVLRIILLSEIPPGVNRDEASIGYTAYSLLKTGRDEYGVKWPLSIQSFGDWKLPLYIYLTMPTVAVFGLNDFAVRLPSVIFGTLTVILTYLITQKLFGKSVLSLLAAFLLTISPWEIFFSRVASEANLAGFLCALAYYLLLKATKNIRWLPASSILLVSSMLAYHGNHIFTPLLFLVLVVCYRQIYMTKTGIISIFIFVVATAWIFSFTLFSADKTKLSGLFAVNDISLVHENIVLNRQIYPSPLLAKIFNNKLIFALEQISQNYINAFSPEFLFIRGGGNRQHNIPDFGNLYIIEAPFILLGLYFLFIKKEKSAKVLILWILIAPVGAALTKDAPHSARTFAILPALTVVIAFGIYSFMLAVRITLIRRLMIGLLLLLLIADAGLFFARYYVVFPYKSYADWGAGYKEMVNKVMTMRDKYKGVIISKPDYSPYIYYLFKTKADPLTFQKNAIRYKATTEGFTHVKEYDGILYKQINWTEELLVPDQLYIDWVESVPSGATNGAILITEKLKEKNQSVQVAQLPLGSWVMSRIVDQVNLPDKQPMLYLIETRLVATPPAEIYANQ